MPAAANSSASSPPRALKAMRPANPLRRSTFSQEFTLDDGRSITASSTIYPEEGPRPAGPYSPYIAAMPAPRLNLKYEHSFTEEVSHDLPALQLHSYVDDSSQFEPVVEDDPASYDLVAPAQTTKEEFSLEKRSQMLFSKEHLQVIFADPSSLFKFTSFLGIRRPKSVPILVYYLDALKALRAIHYANAICEGLDPIEGLDFTNRPTTATLNTALEERAQAAFDILVKEELPAFITHQYIEVVSTSISSRITGALAPHLIDASDGLAEVFCLTDPSRHDNPIVFASEEFNRFTQYGMSHVLGRNCRFLQGPWTNPLSVRRIKDSIDAGTHHQEVFLNYRRDGSPFMNLLMTAPLCDSRGIVRYFIGAQVDVSGLVKECSQMESLQKLVDLQANGEAAPELHKPSKEKSDELRELAEMLNQGELSTIRKHGGRMHRDSEDDETSSTSSQQPRLLLRDPNTLTPPLGMSGKLSGVYQNYLLVRPYPSLRILFASPSQRVPGILQSPFMSKIGGSNRVREELTAAFAEARGVTAKVRWVASSVQNRTGGDEDGRNRWIHCTPLVGASGRVGVWVVIIVDDEREVPGSGRRWKQAPPVANGSTLAAAQHGRKPAHWSDQSQARISTGSNSVNGGMGYGFQGKGPAMNGVHHPLKMNGHSITSDRSISSRNGVHSHDATTINGTISTPYTSVKSSAAGGYGGLKMSRPPSISSLRVN